MEAFKGWTIVKYDKEEDVVATESGILVPSARNQRVMMKGKTHTISGDPDHDLPDIMRIGEVVCSTVVKQGSRVLFNKHDGTGFQLNGEYLFAIRDELLMAGV